MQGWKKDMFCFRVCEMVSRRGEEGMGLVKEVEPERQGTAQLGAQLWSCPLGLWEAVECGWCESGFGLDKARGMQLWAGMSGRRVCTHPYLRVKRKRREENRETFCGFIYVFFFWFFLHLCVYQFMGMFVFIHTMLFATFYWPQLRPHLRERNIIRTHFLFEGSGHALLLRSPETSELWDRTRLQQATSLRDWSVCQSAESSFVQSEPVRRRWQLAFVLEISCPVLGKGSVKVHWGAIAPLPYSLLYSSLPPSFFFPPLEFPLVIFPTDQL